MIVETPRYFVHRRRAALAWMATLHDAVISPRERDKYINLLLAEIVAWGAYEEN